MATAVLPPTTTTGGKSATTTVNGVPHTAQAGQVHVADDTHGAALATQSWQVLGTIGTTAQRPTAPTVVPTVPVHIDVTTGKAIFWDGANWRDPVTGKVA